MKHFILLLILIFTFSLTSCASRVRIHKQTTTIKVVPKNHKIIVLKGKRYYFWSGRYYKKTKRGFVIVKV